MIALGAVDHDVAGAQLLDIVAGAADRDRSGMMEAMADRGDAALDARDLDRHELVAQQGDDALQRAYPAQALGRLRRRAPAHRLGPGEGVDDMGDRAGEHRSGDDAGAVDHGEQHLVALTVVALDELLARQAGRAQEALDRLGRRIGARALALLARRRGHLGDAADDQREAARGGIALDAFEGQVERLQARLEQRGQIGARLFLHAGGNFFRAELEEEIFGHLFSSREGAKARREEDAFARRRDDATSLVLAATDHPAPAAANAAWFEVRTPLARRTAVVAS